MSLTRDRRRFFIASGCPIGTTTRYRCLHLREQLQSLGHEAEVAEWFDEGNIDPRQCLGFDVVVLYRLTMSPPIEQVIAQARESGQVLIFDTDDLIFEPDLVESQRGVKNLPEEAQKFHVVGVQRYLATLLACDGVTTATPFLAELVSRRDRPAFVHRNALGAEMLAQANRLHQARQGRPPNERIVIGYGSGTPTHEIDFEEAAPALRATLDRFAEVELWIVGPLTVPVSLTALGNRVRILPLTDWEDWFEVASRMDIAIAPLEMGNVFCRAKSEVKFIEAGALGVPLVASKIDPYEEAITQGADGLLAANDREWTEALASLVQDSALRVQMGEAARRTILQHYSPQIRAADLADTLDWIFASVAGGPKRATIRVAHE